MLYDPTRHEALQPLAWNEDLARETIRRVVRDTEDRFSADRYWPLHPRDVEADEDRDHVATTLYYGACGVIWALRYLHGFVATASPLIRGRHLLGHEAWAAWQACIFTTITRTAICDGDQASWPTHLVLPGGRASRALMQFCHGAPGFVVCLSDFPGAELDDLLLAAGRAVWAAGPLTKGSNLCHGTGGNGYTFLKLYQRTQDPLWLGRARAFAMHGIAQTDEDAVRHGQMRYSLWTGDPGFAIYLWDCVRGKAVFPTLDAFYV